MVVVTLTLSRLTSMTFFICLILDTSSAFGMGNSWNWEDTQKELSNSYETLGVDPHASDEDIRKTWRQLGLQYHPDKNKQPSAAEKFKEIRKAYENLENPERRQEYDFELQKKELIEQLQYMWYEGQEFMSGIKSTLYDLLRCNCSDAE